MVMRTVEELTLTYTLHACASRIRGPAILKLLTTMGAEPRVTDRRQMLQPATPDA